MADNVGYTPGTGATVAADDIGGVLYQRVKLAVGDDGSATDVSASNPIPVVVDGTAPVPTVIQDSPAFADLRELSATTVRLLDSPRGYDKSLQRQRGTVIVESGTVTTVSTVSTVTTVTTVSSLSTIDSIQGRIAQFGANLSAWADCVRSRIS